MAKLPDTELTIAAVKAAMNDDPSNTVGGLCCSDRVNKWSKLKPIRYNKDVISDAERIGMPSETTNGYFYGVKLAGPQTNFPALHDVDFEYHAVSIDWPCRIGDFRGYDHNAVANLSGSMPSSGINTSYAFGVTVNYTTANTTGIDYASAIGGAENVYPCILLSSGGNHYAQALILDSTGAPAVLSTRNVNYHCRLDNFPMSALGTWKATMFVLKRQNGDSFIFDGRWNDVSTDRGAIWLAKPFALPSCVNLTMSITRADNTPMATPTSIFSLSSGPAIVFSLDSDYAETLNMQFIMEASNSVTKTMDLAVGSPLRQSPRFSWDELGMMYAPGLMTTVWVTIRTKKASSSSWTTGPTVKMGFTM